MNAVRGIRMRGSGLIGVVRVDTSNKIAFWGGRGTVSHLKDGHRNVHEGATPESNKLGNSFIQFA
jgi:hypothetical protein